MGGSSAADIQHHVKIYYRVFAALAVLTAITVAVAQIGYNQEWSLTTAVAIALLVASIKGTLVACYFMHLISEKGMLFWILGLCALFFVMLLAIPAMTDHESMHRAANVSVPPVKIHESVHGAAHGSGH